MKFIVEQKCRWKMSGGCPSVRLVTVAFVKSQTHIRFSLYGQSHIPLVYQGRPERNVTASLLRLIRRY